MKAGENLVYGTHFIWNGIDSRDFNLMLCSFGEDSDEEISTALGLEPITDNLIDRTIDYGAKQTENLVFSLTLIKNQRCKINDFFTRSELREVLAWLTFSKELNWLTVYDGTDTTEYNYYCRFTNVSTRKLFGKNAAIVLEVTCDSPFSYSSIKEESLSTTKINYEELAHYSMERLCIDEELFPPDAIINDNLQYWNNLFNIF